MTDSKRAPYDFNRVKKITPQDPDMGKWHKQEKAERFVFIAPNPTFDKTQRFSKRYVTPIDIRITWTGETCHAYLWANDRKREVFTRGHGKAGGGGYCKTSAAIDYAFDSAGIEMERSFGGCGERSRC